MRILISNDDGINARGIKVLAERLSQHPEYSVYVVAPDRERSATGHALTLHKPLRVEEVQMGNQIKGAWAVTGTPSDCIKFAVGALFQEKPDFVLSGINHGPNLGADVLYSGTVSAAMEGAIFNIPSIAVSLERGHDKHFETAADFIADLLKILPQAGLSRRTLLNVNVPNLKAAEVQGIALTELGVRNYTDYYEKRVDPRGNVYYWLAGEAIDEGESEASDIWAVLNKQISITPISFNMTDRPTIEKLRNWNALAQLHNKSANCLSQAVESNG